MTCSKGVDLAAERGGRPVVPANRGAMARPRPASAPPDAPTQGSGRYSHAGVKEFGREPCTALMVLCPITSRRGALDAEIL